MGELWSDPVFHQTALISICSLFALAFLYFPIRKKNAHTVSGWASIQSWLIGAPLLFIILGAGNPWTTIGFTLLAITACKEFFQITGMYHRSLFVWITYAGIIVLSYSTYNDKIEFFNLLPMIFLGIVSLIPILQNSTKNMLQYIALSLLAFMFIGWAFLHVSLILRFPNGVFDLIYITLLTEICDNITLFVSKFFGKTRYASNITQRRRFEGFLFAIIATICLGYFLKVLLAPDLRPYWLTISAITIFVGSLGDLVLSVVRRDIGVRDTGLFIIGRGGVLDRLDRLIFVAPIFYYLAPHLKSLAALPL